MHLTIHRGSKEIGGNCVELRAGGSRILIDFGMLLVDENREPLNAKKWTKEEWFERGYLPKTDGLYEGEQAGRNYR